MTRGTSASHRAQASGDAAEDLVQSVHDAPAFRREVAALERRYARLSHTGIYMEGQGPDFSGFLVKDARHVEIEVKAVPVGGLGFERLTWRQVRELTACRRAGGVSVLLCLVGAPLVAAAWCPVPWASLESEVLVWVLRALPAWQQSYGLWVARGAPGKGPRNPGPWSEHVKPLAAGLEGPGAGMKASLSEEELRNVRVGRGERYLEGFA